MKHLFSCAILALFFFACTADKSAQCTLDHFTGEWVKVGYKAELTQSGSPRKASHVLIGNTGVCIGPATDSASVLVIINNHEGFNGTLHKSNGASVYPLSTNEIFDSRFVFNLKMTPTDTLLVLTTYDTNNTVKGVDTFERITSSTAVQDPCGLTVVDVLLKGTWNLLNADSLQLASIDIDSLGQISGCDSLFTAVSVQTDFIANEDQSTYFLLTKGEERHMFFVHFLPMSLRIYNERDELCYILSRDDQ